MKIILFGYGRMGKVLFEELKENEIEIVDRQLNKNLSSLKRDYDVLIDFSYHTAIKDIKKFMDHHHQTKVIIGTTGYTCEEEKTIQEIASYTTVIKSSNYSYGIYLLRKMLRKINVSNDINLSITEIHNEQKKDKPSGTALEIAKQINMDKTKIKSIRYGDYPGTHIVNIALKNEVLTIKHEAKNRKAFITGIKIILKKIGMIQPGLYNFESIMDQYEK